MTRAGEVGITRVDDVATFSNPRENQSALTLASVWARTRTQSPSTGIALTSDWLRSDSTTGHAGKNSLPTASVARYRSKRLASCRMASFLCILHLRHSISVNGCTHRNCLLTAGVFELTTRAPGWSHCVYMRFGNLTKHIIERSWPH